MPSDMKKCFYIFLLFIPILFGMSDQKNVQSFSEYMSSHGMSYREADITDAKKLIFRLIDTINEYKASGVAGLDYEWMLLCSYSRLYLIDSKLANKKSAQKYLSNMKSIITERPNDQQMLDKEIKDIVEFVKGIDVQNSVRWIKE